MRSTASEAELAIDVRKQDNQMSELPKCPECGSEYCYEDGFMYVCPDCAHEWSQTEAGAADETADTAIKDANGNPLQDGDTVTLIKDLKVKGAQSVLKAGTCLLYTSDAADE